MDTNSKQGLFNDVIPDKMNTALMLDTAWLLLEAGLFPGYRSDKATKDLARTFIGSFILAPGDPYRYYAAFCQRILLTRHYIDTHPGFSFDFTIISWLDPANARGFNGTKAWFDNLLDKRKKSPMHRIELKAFPEAML